MHKPAIIVAGMGRCGTSLMMQMLHRAAIPCVGQFPDFETDQSYFRSFKSDYLENLGSKAIKILDPMRLRLPMLQNHICLWMDRNPKDQADSAAKLLNLTQGVTLDRAGRRAMAKSYHRDRQPNQRALLPLPMLCVEFGPLVMGDISVVIRISAFLKTFGWDGDIDRMKSAIIHRSPECLDGMLEWSLVERMRA